MTSRRLSTALSRAAPIRPSSSRVGRPLLAVRSPAARPRRRAWTSPGAAGDPDARRPAPRPAGQRCRRAMTTTTCHGALLARWRPAPRWPARRASGRRSPGVGIARELISTTQRACHATGSAGVGASVQAGASSSRHERRATWSSEATYRSPVGPDRCGEVAPRPRAVRQDGVAGVEARIAAGSELVVGEAAGPVAGVAELDRRAGPLRRRRPTRRRPGHR